MKICTNFLKKKISVLYEQLESKHGFHGKEGMKRHNKQYNWYKLDLARFPSPFLTYTFAYYFLFYTLCNVAMLKGNGEVGIMCMYFIYDCFLWPFNQVPSSLTYNCACIFRNMNNSCRSFYKCIKQSDRCLEKECQKIPEESHRRVVHFKEYITWLQSKCPTEYILSNQVLPNQAT